MREGQTIADNYAPPFPYFGGKASIAHEVWAGLGNVGNYVEPFFGSGAVLFRRPHAPKTETVNDADGFVANFWRAVKRDVDAVAQHADNPVNEADLHARHCWLLGQRERITERLMGDPDFYDAKVAGWWCWGLCCWIGSGWCTGQGPWQSVDGVLVNTKASQDGVWRTRPHLGSAGQGVNRQLPHLGDAGQVRDQLIAFADRLRNVRVCCGDWKRVCGPSPTFKHGTTGVFLDPPYADTAGRDPGCYAVDSLTVAHEVREWAIEAGKNPLMRIVLAGYEGEHEMPPDWRVVAWKAKGGYGSQADEDSDARGRVNATKERLWFSPACLREEEGGLFATGGKRQ